MPSCSGGGKLVHGTVAGFGRAADGTVNALQLQDGRRLDCKTVIVVAGVYSKALARQLGEHIPLESERGYHTQIMAPGGIPRHSFLSAKHAFMISPTAGGVRVGGTVEMAGLTAAPDYRRARVLLKHAKEILPDLQFGQTSEWMGQRPSLPDTIPLIGRSRRAANLYYSTGHGHLGLTHSAPSARLMADILQGKPSPIDMSPYGIDRFR